jgi:hypothetical protein
MNFATYAEVSQSRQARKFGVQSWVPDSLARWINGLGR